MKNEEEEEEEAEEEEEEEEEETEEEEEEEEEEEDKKKLKREEGTSREQKREAVKKKPEEVKKEEKQKVLSKGRRAEEVSHVVDGRLVPVCVYRCKISLIMLSREKSVCLQSVDHVYNSVSRHKNIEKESECLQIT